MDQIIPFRLKVSKLKSKEVHLHLEQKFTEQYKTKIMLTKKRDKRNETPLLNGSPNGGSSTRTE